MTEIEKKALALVNEVREGRPYTIDEAKREYGWCFQALCRAIEQHEAYRQEVSDVVEQAMQHGLKLSAAGLLSRFIIAKPDPLVEAWKAQYPDDPLPETSCDNLRAAIEKRGGKIVWEDK